MVIKLKFSVLLILFAVSLLVPVASLAVIVDDFQFGSYTLGREELPMPYTVSATQIDAGGIHILGGQRDVTFEKITGSGTQPYVAMVPGFG